MNQHQIETRVRYAETDKMGVVYHANYLIYLEIARVEWLRNQGINYKDLEDEGIALPVVNINIDYKKSAKYDDLLTVVTSLIYYKGVKVIFESKIYNQDQKLLTEARVTLVFVNIKTGRPIAPNQNIDIV
ncbi:MAG: acyl-CoA thioesterase, partial [Flavobacterium sp.]